MTEQSFDSKLQEQIERLPREMQPQRDLWPGIDQAIEELVHRQPSRTPWYALAASIAVVSLVLLTFTSQQTETRQDKSSMGRLVSQLSQQHEEQKQFLLTGYAQQPALTDNWQAQLTELDEAATAIKTALREDPNNAAMVNMLQQVYQQQIKLIQSVHRPGWF